MIHLSNILEFTELLNTFRRVERMIRVNGEARLENDVEHSFFLAMLAWYIIDANNLKFDKNKVVMYALIHDFVEVYAGDTYIYTEDTEHIDSKKQREKDAALKLKKEFVQFKELHKMIETYERRQDKESRFVYVLDKIQPILNIYTDGGRTWKEKNITLAMLYESKKDKITESPELQCYFDELITLLRSEEDSLFSSK